MNNVKGLIVFHHNMEDGEAIFTKALLKRAKIDIKSVSVVSDLLINTAFGQKIYADFLLDEIDVKDYDFLVIPGGKYVSQILGNSKAINSLIKSFDNANKYICAICAAPAFLGELNLLLNKEYTCFPSMEKEVYKGIYKQNKPAVIDGNIITSRSAGTIYDFVDLIVKTVVSQKAANELKEDIKISHY